MNLTINLFLPAQLQPSAAEPQPGGAPMGAAPLCDGCAPEKCCGDVCPAPMGEAAGPPLPPGLHPAAAFVASARGDTQAAARPRFEGPLRAILVRRLAARTGHSESDIHDALDQLDTGRPILDWLKNGGFEEILKAVLALLKLFA